MRAKSNELMLKATRFGIWIDKVLCIFLGQLGMETKLKDALVSIKVVVNVLFLVLITSM